MTAPCGNEGSADAPRGSAAVATPMPNMRSASRRVRCVVRVSTSMSTAPCFRRRPSRQESLRARRSTVVEQRIFFGKAHKSRGGVLGCRIRASPLRKGEVFYAGSTQQSREAIVSFDAARLVVDPILLVALPGELLLDGPSLGPHRRIFDGHDVFERGRRGPRPALDEVQVLARALILGLRAEVRHV